MLQIVDTGIDGSENRGLEGVSYSNDPSDDVRWVAVQENPARLITLDREGTQVVSLPLDLADARRCLGLWGRLVFSIE